MYSIQSSIRPSGLSDLRSFKAIAASRPLRLPGRTVVTPPGALLDYPQFLVWRLQRIGDRLRKVPFNPRTGRTASVADPESWTSYETARAAVESGHYSGLGFVFSVDDPFVGIDIDDCRDPETGLIKPWA